MASFCVSWDSRVAADNGRGTSTSELLFTVPANSVFLRKRNFGRIKRIDIHPVRHARPASRLHEDVAEPSSLLVAEDIARSNVKHENIEEQQGAVRLAFHGQLKGRLEFDIALGLVITLVIAALCLKKRKARIQDRPLPPGPTGVPVLGYLPFLGSSPHFTYQRLAAKYGPIVRVKLGSEDVVVLNDLDSIKEGLNKDELLARPAHFILKRVGIDGITTLNGQAWVDNRRFCMHVLRDLGFSKKSMEEHIKEETSQFCDVLTSWNGTPGKMENVITSSVSNNVTALLFGERFSYDDPRRKFLDKATSTVSRNASSTSALDFLPALRKLLSYFPSSKTSFVRAHADSILAFVRQVYIYQRSKKLSSDVNRDFIDAYLKKINEGNGANSSFNLRTLMGNSLLLFGAGTNPVKASIEWSLLKCAHDPEGVQRKLQQEIDNVVGRERAPEWEDRRRMPYTMAFIWEVLRWRIPNPLGLIRIEKDELTRRSLSPWRPKFWLLTLPWTAAPESELQKNRRLLLPRLNNSRIVTVHSMTLL
ncbi:hypothetical protein HPB47_018361 [Ixodes persulcatus]|uniref:Uncharacterized protein n=1 Tax=Ixodes persulcatus TaxID=34615 RepID=A0AC60QLY2_IXOPE|nr:hypothetical protein HPB47_018361 [Ixodes persulcatus]